MTALGWGDLSEGAQAGSDQLQDVRSACTMRLWVLLHAATGAKLVCAPLQVSIPYISPEYCRIGYTYNYSDIAETTFCAGGGTTDTCQGDSGGPLILDGQAADADMQAGVVSWGGEKDAYGQWTGRCASVGTPGVRGVFGLTGGNVVIISQQYAWRSFHLSCAGVHLGCRNAQLDRLHHGQHAGWPLWRL